jgi:UDP-N-acetylmuramoyl-tripeptide--D-alanyl-D-alanine ligase
MAAVAIGMHYGVPPAAIKKAIESYQPGNQRSQVITKGSMQIILDAYNANPSSMQEAIGNLKTAFQGQKYIALGEMLELGDYAIIEHEKIGELLQNLHAEQVLLVGSNFEKVATKYNYQYFSDSAHASAWLKDHLPTAGTLLVKGSRGSKMEKILDAFT